MPLRNTDTQFGSVAKGFHWIVAILVIIMIFLGFFMGDVTNKTISSFLYTLHKSIGLTILFIMVLRYLWRISGKVPKFPVGTPIWVAFMAKWNQGLLYLCVTLMPLSGWIMSTAAGHAPNFWWAVVIPAPWTPKNKTLSHITGDIHQYLAWIIVGLLCLHILGALHHWIFRRDGVMQRMLPKSFQGKKQYYEN